MDPQGSASTIPTTSATGPAVDGTVGERIVIDREKIERWLFDESIDRFKLHSTQYRGQGAYAKLGDLQEIAHSRPKALVLKGLNGNELDAVLRITDPVLKELTISYPTSTSAADITEIYQILGEFLGTTLTPTLRLLDLKECQLTAEGEGHLLTGLTKNADPALEELRLPKWESGVQIADIIRSAPRLLKLELRKITILDRRESLPLADLPRSLKSLVLEMDTPRYDSDLLLRAVLNLRITSLKLYGVMESTGKFLQDVLSSNRSLQYLAWDLPKGQNMDPKQWSHLGYALAHNSSLKLFRVGVHWTDVLERLKVLESSVQCVCLCLNSDRERILGTTWVSSCEKRCLESQEVFCVEKPIVELHFFLQDVVDKEATEVWPLIAKALSRSISSLHLEMSDGLKRTKGSGKELFWKAFRACSTLQILTIEGGKAEYCPGGWKELLDCLLCRKSKISHLRLKGCDDLDDDLFGKLIEILRVKSILKRIDVKGTPWDTDRKKILIKQALDRKEEQDSYLSKLNSWGLPEDRKKPGRLFLCGSPSKGKTILWSKITQQGAKRFIKWFSSTGEEKSNGIKVKPLKDYTEMVEMRIAVWDIPSEWSLLTLQYILFPRTNYTFIFLFVFSTYVKDTHRIKQDLDVCFKKELGEFLLCISSSSQIIGQEIDPVVVVVISSYEDETRSRNRPDTTWATKSIESFHEKYDGSLRIINNPYTVTISKAGKARSEDMSLLIRDIAHTFRGLFKNPRPVVPEVVSQISSELAKRTKDIEDRPVWSAEKFDRFCKDSLKVVKDLQPPTQTEVLKAMAFHLHDTGIIIKIPNPDRIIVDPTGLINMFLGELVTLSKNFEELKSSPVQMSMSLVPIFNTTGPVSSEDIESYLTKFSREPTASDMNYDRVSKLLNHFSFLNNLKGVNAKYYIPILEASQRTDIDPRVGPLWCSSSLEDGQEDGLVSIGFRVQCGNPNQTSQFQMYIRHKVKVKIFDT